MSNHDFALSHHDLALLAYMAHIGTSVLQQQLLSEQIPPTHVEPTKHMLSDANALLARLREFAETDMVAEEDPNAVASDLSEVGKPKVGNIQ